jgi:hypothetical protein
MSSAAIAYYRERARKLRETASTVAADELKVQLLEIAQEYDQLAQDVDLYAQSARISGPG